MRILSASEFAPDPAHTFSLTRAQRGVARTTRPDHRRLEPEN